MKTIKPSKPPSGSLYAIFRYKTKETLTSATKLQKNRVVYAFIALVAIILSSCAPAYIPNVINTPLLSNKGEVQIAAYTGLSGFDPQLSYAVTDHIGVMLNGSFANRTSDTTDNFHKHQFTEIGLGYYTKLGSNGRFEAFGGGGFGKLKAEYDNQLWQSYSDVKCTRFFIQPTIGAVSNIFDGSISSRFVFLNLHQSGKQTTGLFIEPALTGKLGYKYIKAVFQIGISMPLSSNGVDFNYQPFMFSIGLQAMIGKIHGL